MNLYPRLGLYASLARFRLLKGSYVAKIMMVAFLGSHIPLLALVLSFILSNTYSWEMTVRVLGTALLATLGGTVVTLYSLRRLLSPVILTSTALQDYLNTQALPKLPTEFTDEVGALREHVILLERIIH